MANSFTFKKVKYTVLSGTNVCVAKSESHKKLDGDLVIPETIEKNGTTYNVIAMEDWCLSQSAIRSVSLPKGLKVIPYAAFFRCEQLVKADIPDTVNTIGLSAFEGCSLLSDVTIPDSVNAIEDGAFNETRFLHDQMVERGYVLLSGSLLAVNPDTEGHFDVPEGTRIICGNAFDNCSRITSISVPEGIKILDSARCERLKEITLPNTLTKIGNRAFYNCKELKEVTLPNSLASIGKEAFRDCGIEQVTIPEGILAIPEHAFLHCTSLRSVTLPDSLKRIEESAFERCLNLEEIRFPEHLEVIGQEAFKYCNSLRSVVIPPSVRKVDFCAFLGCGGLTSVKVSREACGKGAFADCNYVGKSYGDIPGKMELCLGGNPFRFSVFSNVPEAVAENLSEKEYLDLGDDYIEYDFLPDGDLTYADTGKDCFFSRDMLDWKAASSFYNEEFVLETFIKDRSKDAYVVIDMRQIHKASWKYGFDLEGKPFNSNLFMFHRCYSSSYIHKMMGIGSGRVIVFSPEEAFYCEKPCEVEFLADSGQWGGVCRFVFFQGKMIKKLEYK